MRPLTEEETKIFFEKLSKFIGDNIRHLIDRQDGSFSFRLHRDRVYYMNEELLTNSLSVSRKQLISVGSCFGKFTAGKKFRLHITALEFLAQYATGKVWVKSGAEQSFLYGNNVLKSGVGRISDSISQHQGVVVFSMANLPLGFGVAAKSTQESRHSDPGTIIVLHQADIGEYIRNEDNLI